MSRNCRPLRRMCRSSSWFHRAGHIMLGFSQHIGQSAVAIVVSPMRLRMQPIHATCGSLQTMHAACGPPLRHEHLVSNAGSMRAILYALIFLHISSASASNLIMEFHHAPVYEGLPACWLMLCPSLR